MDNVYGSMSPSARKALPREYPKEIGEYVNAIVSYALYQLDEFETELECAVVGNFEENSRGERFILDPLRTSGCAKQYLFVDVDGELVTVRGPKLERSSDSGSLVLKTYSSYEVLTGPQAGTTFGRNERRLPAHPELRARLGAASAAPTADGLEGRFTDFLSRISSDDEIPVSLQRRDSSSAIRPETGRSRDGSNGDSAVEG
jgi:hypothetical protein